ncbi:outer membrane beta-barrel family protein [Bacteroides helcogenes]|uniref:TonB-dependent receptor plug n=1 Tax=Bacteroides helcogenes (strain ATCC 35417 / DSM 20613 / JCM 6297 / CCUG 15421 / P 36-108) TaxID=693979 RepID=E6SV04_BACT6|nr:outer membrane beta-barrel family protein [Bacteroides helcogenes]ADV42440.1 TonB-dependent receptor plug [Bacteroides helcogenes P 36-108]MDY5237797.1 outer membrane beta-barrel family protein [Bacteroides helcogenes]
MRIKWTVLLWMLMVSGLTAAQNTANISFQIKGILLDSLTQEGEPYATIKIVKKEAPAKALKMLVTDMKGRFREKVPGSGDFVMTISSVGRNSIVKSFSVQPGEKEVDFGTLYVTDASKELGEVEIVAQKPLVKVDVDKIEYNIEDDPDSKTNSVIEMLRKVPLVTVDGEDNIKVNGSSSFKIHVNGKPNNMMSSNPKDVLKSMPANTIKYIEVITSPGAKYDAEGVGGILNIVTVGGGFEGYTASFSGRAGNRGLGASTWATIKQGKLTLTGNYSYSYNDSPASYSEGQREDYGSTDRKYLDSEYSSNYNGSFQHGDVEASYEIDTLRLITMSVGMYGGGSSNDSEGGIAMWNAARDTKAYSYRSLTEGDGSWYSVRGNIDYQRTSKRNKDRMLTLSYKVNTQPQEDDNYNRYLDRYQVPEVFQLYNSHTFGKTNTTEHTFQVDYTTPIGKLHTVETGVKYIIRNNVSKNTFEEDKSSDGNGQYVYNEGRSSHYKHLNDIVAAYLGYTLRYKGFSFKPGLRFEHTAQDVRYIVGVGENFKVNYNNLVPSVSLGFKLSQTQTLRGGYDMRIYRPGIWSLNPYFDDRSPMSIRQGNSSLSSEKSHAFSLNYSSFAAKFNINVGLRHSFNNSGIESVSRLIGEGGEDFDNGKHHASEGALYSTYQNIGKSRRTDMNLYLNWNASSKTRLYVNGSGGYSDLRSPVQNLHNFGWQGSMYAGIQHTFPWKLRASLNAGGSTPYISLQGKGSGYNYYGLSVNRSFLKDRLTVSVYGSNLFSEYIKFDNKTFGENFYSTSKSRYPNRSFGMSISYRIGNLRASVKKAARSINNDDVKGGGGGGEGGQGGGN